MLTLKTAMPLVAILLEKELGSEPWSRNELYSSFERLGFGRFGNPTKHEAFRELLKKGMFEEVGTRPAGSRKRAEYLNRLTPKGRKTASDTVAHWKAIMKELDDVLNA